MKKQLIIQNLKNKSNIDYYYYHNFWNNILNLDFNINNFTINYIVYIVNSDFSWFTKFYEKIKNNFITDVFVERITFNKIEKQLFFSMIFNKLFWLKLNNIYFDKNDYLGLIDFLNLNKLDINRIFLENMSIQDDLLYLFNNLNWFNNLSFINLDNNLITYNGINNLVLFLTLNYIDLEYLSLVWNKISDLNILNQYLINSKNIRILDLSGNNILNIKLIIDFLYKSKSIKELYIKNIFLSNHLLDELLLFFSKNSNLDFFRFSITKEQFFYKEKFNSLDTNTYFDIDLISNNKIYSTIYFKVLNWRKIDNLDNDYFYTLLSDNLDNDFYYIIKEKSLYLSSWINLFLFDFNDYNKIDFLLTNYSFNYIYLENYKISNNDFIFFINTILKNSNKRYKINFVSIELNYFQLEYLINNFPKNIFYIEVNLNKILTNRELYIMQMLKNRSFIFENMELYSKIFR